MGGSGTLEADLDKGGLERAERIGRLFVEEGSVEKDRETSAVALAGDAGKESVEVRVQEVFPAGEREVDGKRRA